MPIELTCPNGHRLVAKDSNAGRKGKCPVCKVSVTIPMVKTAGLTDSAIVNLLGEPGFTKTNVPPPSGHRDGMASPHGVTSTTSTLPPKPNVKCCPSCDREIDLGYHICPHCHTYIKGLNDF